jgi:hypothetical protein
MSNLMDSILSQMNQDVNKKMDTLFRVVEETKDNLEYPRFLDDPTIQHVEVKPAEKISFKDDNEITQLSNAFNRLRERGESNKLSDSFRSTHVEEIESRTARSFTQTLASYSRYLSILQATT